MKEQFLIILQVLVVVLVVILRRGQQAGDMADAFGDALPEEKLSAQAQVLGVFDKAETNNSSLASTQLILQQKSKVTWCGYIEAWKIIMYYVISNLSMKALHSGSLPDITNVYGDLWPPTESLGMEEQDNGSFKLTADGWVHLGTDHHHAL